MNLLRFVVPALVGIALMLGGPEAARGQFYGGIGYGSPNGFNAGNYASGAYPINNWYVSPYGVHSPGYVGTGGMGFGYTRNYGQVPLLYGPGYGYGGYGGYGYGGGLMGPVVVAPPGIYGGAAVGIPGGPGNVITYPNNGVVGPYSPQYSQQFSQQPAPGLSRPYTPSSPSSAIIELQSQSPAYGLSNLSPVPPSPSARTGANIKLSCPKTAGGPLNYLLNGYPYTIQPGYSQNFRDDRVWTLEFKRGGEESEQLRYTLKPGNYHFAAGVNGWELRQSTAAPSADRPPVPMPVPEPTATPPSTPTPLPPN